MASIGLAGPASLARRQHENYLEDMPQTLNTKLERLGLVTSPQTRNLPRSWKALQHVRTKAREKGSVKKAYLGFLGRKQYKARNVLGLAVALRL